MYLLVLSIEGLLPTVVHLSLSGQQCDQQRCLKKND